MYKFIHLISMFLYDLLTPQWRFRAGYASCLNEKPTNRNRCLLSTILENSRLPTSPKKTETPFQALILNAQFLKFLLSLFFLDYIHLCLLCQLIRTCIYILMFSLIKVWCIMGIFPALL